MMQACIKHFVINVLTGKHFVIFSNMFAANYNINFRSCIFSNTESVRVCISCIAFSGRAFSAPPNEPCLQPSRRAWPHGATENASTENISRRDGIRKHGKPKYEVTRVENVSMENSSTDMQGWNTQVRKTQVRVHICSGRERKYDK